MKSVNPAVYTAIRTYNDVKALPRLTAEWNMNRYFGTEVFNAMGPSWPDHENDVDMFPIESIVEPVRPSKGINKARVTMATVSDGYNSPNIPRYYVAGLEDKYKYWTSPYPSDSAGSILHCAPTVLYTGVATVNKLVIGLENSWASPTVWSIDVTRDGGVSWQTASSAPVIGPDGRATLYWTGAGWSSNRPASVKETTQITGLRVVVHRLGSGRDMSNNPTQARLWNGGIATTNGTNSYFSIIEISARLEMDLTDRLISASDTFDAGEPNQVTPMGTITSNVGRLSLWNGDGLFSNENASSVLHKIVEPNVLMNLEYVYHAVGGEHPVQQFRLHVDSWSVAEDSTVTAELSDSSKFLKEIHPQPGKYENVTLAQAVYRLCDSVGFTDYNIINMPSVADFRIPVFWVDGTQTVWEVFDELATATQSLVYFDNWGRLNVRPRETAYNPARGIDWTLRGVTSGFELADIISLDKTTDYESNVIKVLYKKTAWAGETNGHVKMTTVWSPDETVTLRSAVLTQPLDIDDKWISISPSQASHWPYEGHVQIEGEFIEYSGKWFNYLEGGRWNSVWVHNQKEYDEYNEKTDSGSRHLNNFLGRLKIEERGVWNSDVDRHVPEAKGWSGSRYNHATNSSWATNANQQWLRGSSIMRMASAGNQNKNNEWALMTRGGVYDTPWRHIGTRFRFNGNAPHHRAGIVFNKWGNGDGYYVELRPTNTIDNKDRDSEDELAIYSIHAGNYVRVKSGQRRPDLIVADRWHELDIYFDTGSHRIAVWIDGKRIMQDVVPANARHTPNGRFGTFIRGVTNVDFEYIYAVGREPKEIPDEAGFYDRVRGGYVGDAWQREWVYKKKQRWIKRKGKKGRKNRRKNVKYRRNLQFFDEFGPYVHEVREFDVKFDPAPVAQSSLFFTNEMGIVCPEYRSDAFGAYFILGNASRVNQIASGDDDLTYTGNTVPHQLLVYGRALTIGEQEEVEVRNESQIRARGEIAAEIDSPWIQSEAAAQAVADWIAAHWANGADEVKAEVFGNPLFEVGDVVAIEYPDKHMSASTHQYFVTGISTQFESGLSTTLTLQRKN